MATTFAFYSDAGLTVPLVGGATLTDGAGPTDRLVYFGSPASGVTLRAASAPGSAPVTISPVDASPGTGVEVGAIKLALSAIGLDAAVAGASLTIGTSLAGGAGNAVQLYVRTTQGALVVGSYPGLSLTTNAVVES